MRTFPIEVLFGAVEAQAAARNLNPHAADFSDKAAEIITELIGCTRARFFWNQTMHTTHEAHRSFAPSHIPSLEELEAQRAYFHKQWLKAGCCHVHLPEYVCVCPKSPSL